MRTAIVVSTVVILAMIFIPSNNPCLEPLTYRIGKIDTRFGLNHREISEAVSRAASLWEKALSRDLFQESPQGELEINFVYDYRQEATDKLRSLSYKIENTQSSYDSLKTRLIDSKEDYERKKRLLDSDFNSYNNQVAAFNKKITSFQKQRAIPAHIGRALETRKNELNARRERLNARKDELNRLGNKINDLVVVINKIATNIGLDSVSYNNAGRALAGEFCEGRYSLDKGRQTITIYEFSNRNRLIRLLAHELGHSLGLHHSDDPEAIMYRLIQSDSLELAPDDIAMIKARCGGK